MAEETELQEPKEYKVLVNATNGLFPADNGSLHLSKEQAKAKWEQLLNDGTIPLTGGKTGTSEVMGQKSHSLYVGFGPAEESKIAIAVIVENGGYGSFSAAPVAKKVFQTYFSKYSQAKLN